MKKITGGVITALLIVGGVMAGAASAQAAPKADFSCVRSGASGAGWSYEWDPCPGR